MKLDLGRYLDIETISNFYKPVLEKANDLVSKIEDLDGEMKNHSDMKAYLSSIKTHNIDTLVKKFDEVKHKIIKAKEAEERRKQELQRQRNEEAKRQAELERQRREAKEAEERRKQAELERQRREEIVTIDGLMYQNQPFTKIYTWEEAKEYAKNLRLGGYNDWRLSTKDELMKLGNIKLCYYNKYDTLKRFGNVIFDFDCVKWFKNNKDKRIKNSKGDEHFIRQEFSENMPANAWFFSITEYNNNSSGVWIVGFSDGNYGLGSKLGKDYALCVRGQ